MSPDCIFNIVTCVFFNGFLFAVTKQHAIRHAIFWIGEQTNRPDTQTFRCWFYDIFLYSFISTYSCEFIGDFSTGYYGLFQYRDTINYPLLSYYL